MHESRLKYEVRLTRPVGLIELMGALRLDTVSQVREAVLKGMVERPDFIVLDLARLDDREALSGDVFPALSRTVAAGADGELILAAPSPSVQQAMRRVDPLFVRMFGSLSQAMEASTRARARRGLTRALPADPRAARSARRAIDEMCQRWRLTELREPALVIVSELVNNAAEHGSAPIELRSTVHHRILRIEVSDHGGTMPRSHGASGDEDLHNGLRLVDALARDWGTVPTTWGKTVWADLLIHPAPRCHPAPVR